MQELSLVSQHIFYDHMKDSGDDTANFVIFNDLAKSCKGAHKRYAAALEAKREGDQKDKAEEKWKATENFIRSFYFVSEREDQ